MLWRKATWYRDSIISLVCVTLVLTPFFAMLPTAYADEIIDEANKGQDSGANLLLKYQLPSINNGPPGDPLGPNELNIQELFPGFDPNDPSQLDPFTTLRSDPMNLATQGVAQQFNLQGGTGERAEAYQGLVDGSNNAHNATIDMRNDDFLARSREIISGNDPILDEILTACAEDVTAGDPGTDTVTRLEDIFTCSQRRTGLSGSCTVERDFILLPVATQIILAVAGGACVPTAGGSGKDRSDWNAEWGASLSLQWSPVAGPAQYCRTTGGDMDGAQFMSAVRRGLQVFYHYPYFCGEFDDAVPTVGECEIMGRKLEHACRNAPVTGTGGSTILIRESTVIPGPTGACSTYAPALPGIFNGTVEVDYTGCDADRKNYCSGVFDYYVAECTRDPGISCPNCGTGSGLDINHWGPPNGDWQASTIVNPTGAPECYLNWTLSSPEWYWRINFGSSISAKYCGDFAVDSHTPAQCASTANLHEWRCRNATTFTGGELNPARGPIGICPAQYTGFTIGDPVDYAGCTPERQTYCEAVAAEYLDECSGGCTGGGTCESEDNMPLYDGSIYPNTDVVNNCTTTELFYDLGTAPDLSILDSPGRTYSFGHSVLTDPSGDYSVFGWSTEACGTIPNPVDCSTLGQNFYDSCVISVGGTWTKLWPGGTPPPDIPAYCVVEQATYEANCNAAQVCLGGGASDPLLNGTETIVSPGLGPGFLEILADQNVFGTTVDFEETAFNPSDYGLAAGEYVIADHTVTGTGIDASTIDDGGSYGTNWDFTSTITLTDSPGFEVEATLYEIVANGFIFNGCSQADVQNVDSGVCSGSITCTDHTPPCRIVDGVLLCESPSYTYGVTEVLTPWSDFTSAVPEMCWLADVNIVDCVGETNCVGNPSCVADCNDLPPELQPACLADACWVDAQGATICLDDTSETWVNHLGDPNYVDDCQKYIDDPSCTLMPDVACIEGMEDTSDPTNVDLCLLRQRFFDCGTDITVPGVPGADDVDVTCGAEIRCFGDECANTQVESNPDFVNAMVAASTVSESTKDMTCDIAGDPASCKIFEGTDNRCKDPRGSYLGLIPDCCEQARDAAAAVGDFALYMQLAKYTFKLARDPMVAGWLSQGQVLPSALQNVVNAPGAIKKSIGRHITTGFNSALEWAGFSPVKIATDTAGVQSAVSASATGFGPLQQFVATGFKNFLNSIGAEQLATSLFSTTTEGTVTDWAADGLGEMVGNVLGTIMFIYTVYNIIKILGNIIFACEEEELAFGIQLVNRACHHVGTYCSKKIRFLGFSKCVIETQTHCCFSSPFARIINEQLREQGIGPDWGTATEPNCDGIPITDLNGVDWSLVDLSEWEAILFEAGLVPDPRDPPLNFIPTDSLPGVAEGGSEGQTSTDIMTETIDIIMPEFAEGRFGLEGESLSQPDPDLMPWYDDGTP